MHRRDRIALIIGIVLGIGFSILISISGMGAGAMLLVALLLCPFITSLVAAERIFLAGLVPNIVIAIGGSIFAAQSPYIRTGWDGWLIILSNIGMGIMFALFAAGVVWFVRKKIMRR